MRKYLKYIFTIGLYLIWTYPRFVYYAKRKDKVPYEKRLALYKKVVRKYYKTANVTLNVIGLENIPAENGLAFFPNHQSFIDPTFILVDEKHKTLPVAKIEVSKMPFIGRITRAVDVLFFQRDDLRDAYRVYKQIESILKNKGNILLYAEGTRSKHPDHRMNEFKPASFKAAVNAKATIIPVFLWGFFTSLDIHCKRKDNPATIEFFPPLRPKDYADMTLQEISDYVFNLINGRVQEAIAKDKAAL